MPHVTLDDLKPGPFEMKLFKKESLSIRVPYHPLSYSPTTPLASPLDACRANICCRPGHRVSAQDHRLAAVLNACQRRSPPCNATCRCNRLRCPLARMSGLQCFNMGHNGHGINLYGVSMTLTGN